MTILTLAVGSDRIMAIQDCGTFEASPPHRQTGRCSKILALPHLRMITAGAGHVGTLRAWGEQLLFGVFGDDLASIAEFAPPILRSLATNSTGTMDQTLLAVAGFTAAGRARALVMQRANGFRPEWLTPGALLKAPDTGPLPEATEAEPPHDQAPEPSPQAEPPPDPAPVDDGRDVDWNELRLAAMRTVRLQIAQQRTQFAPPFLKALLTPDCIEIREFGP